MTKWLPKSQKVDQGPVYKVIGLGSCGSVFEIPETDFAVKKGKGTKALWSDYCLTNIVHDAFTNTRDLIQDAFPHRTIPKIPYCSSFLLPTSNDYWEANLKNFPASHREIGAVIQEDRILPIPQSVRETLIDRYFDEEIQDEAKHDEENEACLVRIYLGEIETEAQDYDSLRNFPMRLNMMKDLGLDARVFSAEIAIALATIHWQAQVDAMDSEFVLGSTRATPFKRQRAYDPTGEPREDHGLDFTQRSVHVWVLDFDKASPIELTPRDVEHYLVPAFLGNDPYFPRPDVDEELWKKFSETYLKASRLILKSKGASSQEMHLPKLFLDRVVLWIKENEDWDPEEHIVFR